MIARKYILMSWLTSSLSFLTLVRERKFNHDGESDAREHFSRSGGLVARHDIDGTSSGARARRVQERQWKNRRHGGTAPNQGRRYDLDTSHRSAAGSARGARPFDWKMRGARIHERRRTFQSTEPEAWAQKSGRTARRRSAGSLRQQRRRGTLRGPDPKRHTRYRQTVDPRR